MVVAVVVVVVVAVNRNRGRNCGRSRGRSRGRTRINSMHACTNNQHCCTPLPFLYNTIQSSNSCHRGNRDPMPRALDYCCGDECCTVARTAAVAPDGDFSPRR